MIAFFVLTLLGVPACTTLHPPLRFDWFITDKPAEALSEAGPMAVMADGSACSETKGPAMYVYLEHFADDDGKLRIKNAKVVLNALRKDNWINRELNHVKPPDVADAWTIEGVDLLPNTVYVWPAGCFRKHESQGQADSRFWPSAPASSPSTSSSVGEKPVWGCRVAVSLDVIYNDDSGTPVSMHAELPRELPTFSAVELMSRRCLPPMSAVSAPASTPAASQPPAAPGASSTPGPNANVGLS